MKKIDENTKVTLTLGQLKKLVKETKMKQSNDDRFDIRNGVLIRYKSDIYTDEIEIPKGVKKIAEFAITGEVCDCVRVPEGVTEIEGAGISNNDRLRTLVLPRSLTRIGNRAFCWCSRLNYIVLHGKSKKQALQLLRDAGIPGGDPYSGFIKIGLDDDNTYIYTGTELKLVRWDGHRHVYVVVDK